MVKCCDGEVLLEVCLRAELQCVLVIASLTINGQGVTLIQNEHRADVFTLSLAGAHLRADPNEIPVPLLEGCTYRLTSREHSRKFPI